MTDEGFTKLYRGITKSTVWVGQPWYVKLAWVVVLAEADALGRVTTPIPALAKLAEVTIEQFEEALAIFMAPDKYSRSPELDGRRVVPLDGEEYTGFRLVTHEKHRARRDPEVRRQQNRDAQQRYRNKNKERVSQISDEENKNDSNSIGCVSQTVSGVSRCKPIPSASASASASEDHKDGKLVDDPWGLSPKQEQERPDDEQVFDHWLERIWNKRSQRPAKLTPPRRKRIRARLRSYSVAELCSVIDRAALSRFHMGQNDDGKFYGDIDNIMGSDEKVDKWLASMDGRAPGVTYRLSAIDQVTVEE